MKSLIAILSAISSLLFGATQQPPTLTQITIESKTVNVAEKTTLKLTAGRVPASGIASIQGKLTFDPVVMRVNELTFSDKFSVRAKNIMTNEVRFAATITGKENPLRDGVLLEFAVEAIGSPGASSPLRLVIEVLSDPDYKPISHQAVDGTFTIAENQTPIADFSFSPTQPTNMELVLFTNNSRDPDGQIAKHEWDFGDGSKSTERNPVHRYRSAGAFTVTLTVTDDKGASAAKSSQITISEGPLEVRVQAFPNPASTQTTFEYFLPATATSGTLHIFNIKGERVLTEELPVALFQFRWGLSDELGDPVSNGPYFYVIIAVLQDGRTLRSGVQVLVVQR